MANRAQRIGEPRRSHRLLVVVATLVLGSAIAIGVMVGSSPNGNAFAIGVGVLGSLIASFYVVWVNVFVLGDGGIDVGRLEDAVIALRRATPVLEQAAEHSVLALKAKGRYTDADWTALLEDAQRELFIVGHALNKWCRDDMRALFVTTIQRLLAHDGQVQLIMLPLDGTVTARLSDQRGKDYRRRIAETLDVLAPLHAQLSEHHRARLDVRMLLDTAPPMPYMLAGNDRVLITASYPLSAEDSDEMLAVTVEAGTPFASALRKDLRGLARNYSREVDLQVHATTSAKPSTAG